MSLVHPRQGGPQLPAEPNAENVTASQHVLSYQRSFLYRRLRLKLRGTSWVAGRGFGLHKTISYKFVIRLVKPAKHKEIVLELGGEIEHDDGIGIYTPNICSTSLGTVWNVPSRNAHTDRRVCNTNL